MKTLLLLILLLTPLLSCQGTPPMQTPSSSSQHQTDVLILGATPGGIAAAIAAARQSKSVILLERSAHIGGLPANGLGATDIATRGATTGLFTTFTSRIKSHYASTYGPTSQQLKDSSDGYHFEPSVAEKIFHQMLAEYPSITVLTLRQFDALPQNVQIQNNQLTSLTVTNRTANQKETYSAKVFIDATYEGDLAAAAGCNWTTRRESQSEFNEPLAGKVYKAWRTNPDEVGEGSTGEGDDTLQAYNYRLCLTNNPANRTPITQPPNYNRSEYTSLIEDVKLNRWAGKTGFERGKELYTDGIGRIVNMVILPNSKTDSNNQHLAFISTDLPEENYPWPNADWAWRDAFAVRLRNYTLGLLYFAQNDPELPADFRKNCSEWGLAKDEYTDNQNFPRQVYVREGRRIQGLYTFTAHDALPVIPGGRPPIHQDSITASHYALDSHAHHKREPGKVHLDGFLSHPTAVYTVPYRVIVPKTGPSNLLTPVPVSGTHIGFSTLRMEPCWMALGEAAGTAASLMLNHKTTAAQIPLDSLQDLLLQNGATLIYLKDAKPSDPDFPQLQKRALKENLQSWTIRPTPKNEN